jgi:DNA segregation ATPase FtsK/SpoIIIE-like protein
MTTISLPFDLVGETRQAAERVQAALTQLGYCWECKDGTLVQVSYKSLAAAETSRFGPVALLEVDTNRLPRKVAIADLAGAKTTHHLTAVVGKRVGVLNTTGLTYYVLFQPPPLRRLPRRIDLDLESRPGGGPYLLPIGEGQAGPVWRTLAQLDAVLVGGTRRLGKSTWLNAALAALLTAHGPDDLRVALVDPKEVELRQWAAVPHLVGDVATDAAEAEALLGLVLGELETRRALFAQVGARNLEAYNRHADPLPAILLVVDEVADLALEAGGPKADVFKVLARLVGKGGAFGIHAILATQRPDAEAVAGILKANLATRLSFWLPSGIDYRLVLSPAPGQSLPQLPRLPGRMIARLSDGYHVLQGYHLDDDQVAAIARRLSGERPTPAAVLSQAEAELVLWAVEENAGYLSRENLAHGLGLTTWKAGQLGLEWERRGWLAKDPDAGNKRKVTVALLDLLARL